MFLHDSLDDDHPFFQISKTLIYLISRRSSSLFWIALYTQNIKDFNAHDIEKIVNSVLEDPLKLYQKEKEITSVRIKFGMLKCNKLGMTKM